MSFLRHKKTLIAIIAVFLITTALNYRNQTLLHQQTSSLRAQQSQIARLTAENERLAQLLANAKTPPTLSTAQFRELLRLRGEMGMLRSQSKETAWLQDGKQKVRSTLADGVGFRQLKDALPGFQISRSIIADDTVLLEIYSDEPPNKKADEFFIKRVADKWVLA